MLRLTCVSCDWSSTATSVIDSTRDSPMRYALRSRTKISALAPEALKVSPFQLACSRETTESSLAAKETVKDWPSRISPGTTILLKRGGLSVTADSVCVVRLMLPLRSVTMSISSSTSPSSPTAKGTAKLPLPAKSASKRPFTLKTARLTPLPVSRTVMLASAI